MCNNTDLLKYNINEVELDKSIYRIIDFDRLVQILKTGNNTFVRTSMWEDPFENLLTNLTSDINIKNSYYSMSKFTYAQCWSFANENDLLWRTYSPNKESIRLKSTPRKLLNSINNSSRIQEILLNPKILYENSIVDKIIEEGISLFCGKVKYLTKKEIYDFIKSNEEDYDLTLYFESLLIKREPFRNEEEFRIGVYHFNELNDLMLELSESVFHYDIEFNDVFEEIVFDPRISNEKYKGLKDVLREFKFENSINKSDIYDKPNINDFPFS
jgi:hypothetical protein